ncbi:MAG: biotin--[acetyl-CoA-carboxylase] ligase [Gemmatimonadota bacterium]|nr:biotin--[acetyl-CoA-carboxylase] ligase [Gemmatimonadota bacterium]MDP6801689.1 biotin--[acetyl-CoA-carboxylase] ligase [Gemmatimonadota bacterium]MDP7031235.1 biotin--[acetyl-CoA-carboxylase] ligase [Gemmatimonadota bacterium]
MTGTPPADILAEEARLLRLLADSDGEVSVARAAPRDSCAPFAEALGGLAEAGLVAIGADARLRPGMRGSMLVASEVEEALGECRFGRTLEIRATVDSTNAALLARDPADTPVGATLVAEHQSAGRGRRGRSFDSRPGLGIWASVVLPPPSDSRRAPRLSLVAALAVARALESEAGVPARIKWPNDVRMDGRKVCGLLVEGRTAGGTLFPVVGFGVNVHHRPADFPSGLASPASSLEMATGRSLPRSRILAAVLRELARAVDAEEAGELDLPAWFSRRDDLPGRSVVVEEGGSVLRGRSLGIDETGSLLLETGTEGIVAVANGDVSLKEEAGCS